MKKLLTILLIFLSLGVKSQHLQNRFRDSLNALKVSDEFKPTKYSPGFTYYDERGIKVTLLKWTKVGTTLGVNLYRWRVRYDYMGIRMLAWTDDYWIDHAIKKGSF